MKQSRTLFLAMILLLALSTSHALAQTRPEGWGEVSHSNSADPDYDVVFPQDEVNILNITISPENWQAMLDDMTAKYGEFGTRQGPGAGMLGNRGEGMQPPTMPEGVQSPTMPEGGVVPFRPNVPDGQGMRGPGGAAPGGLGGVNIFGNTENPTWIAVDIEFESQTWTNVGFRLKGNSSLNSSWGGGNYKLPFKLDFDQFEDDYPEIKNQRFYGFKQLSFSSNWSDSSLLREKVTADIFREAGVPAAQTAFYAVYVDYGEGPIYFGLYTAVEVVDDTVIQTQFAEDSGNVYKPEGPGATFAMGSFDETSFEKQTNKNAADYSDILALFDALHAETRTSDPAAWRSGLEAVFDVDGFMRWLAVNSVVQNWDTYGQMAHNYYLYNDPTTGLLTWIPWDNNMALADGFGGRSLIMDGSTSRTMPLDLSTVSSDWPLIRFLMDDLVYRARYDEYLAVTIQGAFEPAKMEATYRRLHDLIAPYVVGENGEQPGYTHLASAADFETALEALVTHVNARFTLAQDYLSSRLAASN